MHFLGNISATLVRKVNWQTPYYRLALNKKEQRKLFFLELIKVRDFFCCPAGILVESLIVRAFWGSVKIRCLVLGLLVSILCLRGGVCVFWENTIFHPSYY